MDINNAHRILSSQRSRRCHRIASMSRDDLLVCLHASVMCELGIIVLDRDQKKLTHPR
jgi:hypothetical protein